MTYPYSYYCYIEKQGSKISKNHPFCRGLIRCEFCQSLHSFVSLLKGDLLGGDYIAIDGSKFRAVNSKKNNYKQAKIDRHMAYIENKTCEYLAALEEEDAADNAPDNFKKK